MHYGWSFGFPAPSGPPLNTLTGSAYLQGLLAQQAYPLTLGAHKGVTLTAGLMWLFDSLTDLVGSNTLAIVGGATFGDVATRVHFQSPLVKQLCTFGAVADALAAAADTVGDTSTDPTGSMLAVGAFRVPVTPGATMAIMGKRGGVNLPGYELAMNLLGEVLWTVDVGVPAPVTATVALDHSNSQAGGSWHQYAVLIDRTNNYIQVATDLGASPRVTLPAGSSASPGVLLSFGSGRLQGLSHQQLYGAFFFGSQVEIFNDPSFPLAADNDPEGPTLRANVAETLAIDTIYDVQGTLLL